MFRLSACGRSPQEREKEGNSQLEMKYALQTSRIDLVDPDKEALKWKS